MQQVAKKIPHDQLPDLAAYFNMTLTFRRLQADQANNRRVGFNLLYEWRQAAGVRHELVEALEELGLNQVALM